MLGKDGAWINLPVLELDGNIEYAQISSVISDLAVVKEIEGRIVKDEEFSPNQQEIVTSGGKSLQLLICIELKIPKFKKTMTMETDI